MPLCIKYLSIKNEKNCRFFPDRPQISFKVIAIPSKGQSLKLRMQSCCPVLYVTWLSLEEMNSSPPGRRVPASHLEMQPATPIEAGRDAAAADSYEVPRGKN